MMKFNSKDTNVFFLSDLHAGHKNICRGVTEWTKTEGCRDFVSIEKMDSYLINQINKYVGEDDVIFFLGDWSFGGADNIWKTRSRILCKNIHFILGNHDHHIETNRKLPNTDALAQELFSSVSHYQRVSIDGKLIIMSHFPMISWEKSYRNSWMVHGHCHGTLFQEPSQQWGGNGYWYKSAKIFDVGIDNIFNVTGEYKPISFQELRKIMNRRDIIITDHHDANTQ